VIIIQALRAASSEYVVYFLLAAWLESLEHGGRARCMPADARRLRIRDAHDVYARLRAIRERLVSGTEASPENARVLQDAAAAFAVACERLRELTEPHAPRSGRRFANAAYRVGRTHGPEHWHSTIVRV
jgi:hypothetical protein